MQSYLGIVLREDKFAYPPGLEDSLQSKEIHRDPWQQRPEQWSQPRTWLCWYPEFLEEVTPGLCLHWPQQGVPGRAEGLKFLSVGWCADVSWLAKVGRTSTLPRAPTLFGIRAILLQDPFQALELPCPPVNIVLTREHPMETSPPHSVVTMGVSLSQVQWLHSRLTHLQVHDLQGTWRDIGPIWDNWNPGQESGRTRIPVPLIQVQKH